MPSITRERGDTVKVNAQIRNCGNVRSTIYVMGEIIAPNGYVTNIGQTSVDLDPGQTETITFTETLGPNTAIGTHDVRISTWSDPGFTTILSYNSDWRIKVKEEVICAEITDVRLF